MRMRLIDAESLKELFPDNGEGSWTYNATAKVYIDAQPTIHPDTTTHDSIVVKKGGNDEDRTSGDCISRTRAVDALRDYLVGKRCPDDGTLTCRLIENEVINKLPSAQPEIIRCKDCKHSRFFDPCFYCYEMGGEIIVPENGFCFKAERRTNG